MVNLPQQRDGDVWLIDDVRLEVQGPPIGQNGRVVVSCVNTRTGQPCTLHISLS